MSLTTPTRDNRYQLLSWPPTEFTVDLWNAVFGDLADRITSREQLEASFETLKAQGIQASLDYIQINVAPQLANLRISIELAQEQIDQIIIGGKAPDTLKFGGQLPAYYATALALSEGLAGKVPSARKVNGKELSGDIVLDKSDVGLGNADNTADADKPVSTAQKDAIEARIPYFQSGAALPSTDIGPIWHADYRSVMTWQVFNANGAAYAGYASDMVGCPFKDGQPTARAGYVKRNGASLSKTAYAALWHWALHNGRVVALGSWAAGAFVFADNGDGTFKLPDNRGEFERNWDDGRGVDSGRALGSWQDSTNKTHVHTGTTDASGAHAHGIPSRVSDQNHRHFNNPGTVSEGAEGGGVGGDGTTYSAGNHVHTFTTAASGSAEARPRSVSFNAIIKF
ncbi:MULTISPECIES: hypothetical protein [unclassified Agrobacterium]|uniref:phage tail protein n=1 Tax=unclassified Agrobacterium TaxID=2632611 RepID=UPI0022C5B21E|nr:MULTISPECIES: hypothetical protein [unclassified Agrobacterium]MCZ7499379.1 hypothetical protein [Rhizobium rhizogenes]MDH0613656.1 hypothetical protein [Agrobacterium sp. GD03872]MDH0696545.1 hypothetical protein [Agrobacterium sp. GD03871]MDH1059857.1 hypothetical protein [Agrobacterium sp. GD03992]MDH2210206.1 hypothetical protein [Agrobacterium sp. GD03643]